MLPALHNQGWEFAQWFSEQIARFLLKQMRDSLIRSFLVSDLNESLMVAHLSCVFT